MLTSNHNAQVLITGGSTGIGLGLAQRYLSTGARVMITGRDKARLDAVAVKRPGILTFVSDAADPSAREALARHTEQVLPELSILINNAGIQRRVSLAADQAAWGERQMEIDILLSAPIHLNSLLIPKMLATGSGGIIVNVTSGGAYVPQVFAPVYAACKAALHNYTVTLRHALNGTNLTVKELIPPAVATGLAGPGANHGAPLDEFCDAVFPAITKTDIIEIGFGMTATETFQESKRLYRAMFEQFSQRFPVTTYANQA